MMKYDSELCLIVIQSVKLLISDFTVKPIYKNAHVFFTEGLMTFTTTVITSFPPSLLVA